MQTLLSTDILMTAASDTVVIDESSDMAGKNSSPVTNIL